MSTHRSIVRAAAGLALVSGSAAMAQTITFSQQPAPLNRWMYPFETAPGTRQEASVFASILVPGFDDRDAEFLLGFATAPTIPAGLPAAAYTVNSVRVRAWISQGGRFVYDSTADSVLSSLPSTDPQYVPDADAGSPVEIFAAGYRANTQWNARTFQQTSPFSDSTTPPICAPGSTFLCFEAIRNVFAASIDPSTGAPIDVSRAVRQRLDLPPFAIGQTTSVPVGQLVPQDALFTFDLDLTRPEVTRYVRESLSTGRLNLVVTGLHPASGGPGGGTSTAFPVFYTKENALAVALGFTPAIEISVTLNTTCPANCDASSTPPILNAGDFGCFLTQFRAASALPPSFQVTSYANCDASTTAPVLNAGDFACFISRFRAGCP